MLNQDDVSCKDHSIKYLELIKLYNSRYVLIVSHISLSLLRKIKDEMGKMQFAIYAKNTLFHRL